MDEAYVVYVHRLNKKPLISPLTIIVEVDTVDSEEDGKSYIARSVDFPVYCLDESVYDAVNGFVDELEELYGELSNNISDYSIEFQSIKKLLDSLIMEVGNES